MLEIKQIQSLNECPAIAILFDAYRVFYKQESNIEGATQFLTERLAKKESIILVAFENQIAVGFTQLYPSFSSVSMKPLYILNDLFVIGEKRGQGVGDALLEAAEHKGKELSLKGMILETAQDNPAQRLYERKGWAEDKDYKHYGKFF
jgi:GNAT superfamily N-acetyltransferase